MQMGKHLKNGHNGEQSICRKKKSKQSLPHCNYNDTKRIYKSELSFYQTLRKKKKNI